MPAEGGVAVLRAAAAGLALTAALCVANPVQACLACIEMPQDSLADRVAAADAVALLRPDPGDPFRFAPVAFLRGGPDLPPVPFLVSQARRAEFAAHPDGLVVAVWSEGAGWSIHDFGTPALARTLADLLDTDLSAPEGRRDAFAPLVNHADAAVARMAMVELATVPYPVLRLTDARFPRRQVAAMAADPLWSEWAPIAIVLLGLSDDPADAAFLRRVAEAQARDGRGAHLAAWTTALIEAEGVPAVDWLVGAYGPDGATADEDRLRQIGLAFANHAGRDDATGRAVRAALEPIAAASPAFTAALSGTLMDRADWSLVRHAERWARDGQPTAPGDAFVLAHYVDAAAAAGIEGLP